LFDRQSLETDQQKRKALVWEIGKKPQEDVASDHLSQPGWDLLPTPTEGVNPDGQQHLHRQPV